jgi:hypothetical protein
LVPSHPAPDQPFYNILFQHFQLHNRGLDAVAASVDCRFSQCEYEEHSFVGCNSIQFGRSLLTFRRKISLPSSGTKRKTSKKAAWYLLCDLWLPLPEPFQFLALLIFDPEDGRDIFPWIVSGFLPNYLSVQHKIILFIDEMISSNVITFYLVTPSLCSILVFKNKFFLKKYNSKLPVGYYFLVVLQLAHTSHSCGPKLHLKFN